MMLDISFKDFTINNVFSNLNIIQVILFFVAMLFVLLFGLMLGACIFYPMAIKRIRKLGLYTAPDKKQANYYKKEDQNIEAQMEAMDAKPSASTVMMNFDEEEFDLDEIVLEEEEVVLTESATPTGNRPLSDELDVGLISVAENSGEAGNDAASVMDDPDFNALVEKRKQEIPVLTRRNILKHVNSFAPISENIGVNVSSRSPEEPFDTACLGEYAFLLVYSIKNVLKLIIRMHENVYKKAYAIVGDSLQKYELFGDDWYSWNLTDEGNLNLPLRVVALAYKYVATQEYQKGEEGAILPIRDSYTAQLKEKAKSYNPLLDASYVANIKSLNEKYNLEFFSSTDACTVTKKIESENSTPSATEFVGYRPAVLKTDDHIFGIVFENFGVIKLIFRQSPEYFADLQSKHKYVKESSFPKSRDWKWYSLLIDETYTKEEISQIIRDSYFYVEAYHSEYLMSEAAQPEEGEETAE